MDATTKILVKNTSNNSISISFPDSKFKRIWPPLSEYKVPFEILQDGIYDRGFMVFLEKGMLFIDDKEARVELGLEEEDAVEPIFKTFNRTQLITLLKAKPLVDFTNAIHEMSKEQCLTLIDLALEEGNIDMNKAAVLKEVCGIDVVAAIRLKNLNEEPETKDEK